MAHLRVQQEQGFLVSDAQPGTFVGEITRSAAMFKTFAATIMFEHMRRGIGMGITSPLGEVSRIWRVFLLA